MTMATCRAVVRALADAVHYAVGAYTRPRRGARHPSLERLMAVPPEAATALAPSVCTASGSPWEPPSTLYEDDHLLAIDKPAGLVVHPAYRHPDGTLHDLVVRRQRLRGEDAPWLLHRLDRDTSGVLLFAKTDRARRSVVAQFERRQVRKWYLGLACGCI